MPSSLSATAATFPDGVAGAILKDRDGDGFHCVVDHDQAADPDKRNRVSTKVARLGGDCGTCQWACPIRLLASETTALMKRYAVP